MFEAATIGCAACCWGVDDVMNPHLPHWRTGLDETAVSGFSGLERGNFGYMPLDIAVVSQALAARKVIVFARTVFDDLVFPSNRENLLRPTDEICNHITALAKPPTHPRQRYAASYLTLMDWGHDQRDFAADNSDRAPRLDDAAWAGMIATIRAIAERARDRCRVRATVDPHAGGYIEFPGELARLVADVDAEAAGLRQDTCHLAYAGIVPVATVRNSGERLDDVCFKDIDPFVFEQIMSARIRCSDSGAKGVMCPIGMGAIDYAAEHTTLNELGCAGCITSEQERDPRNLAPVLDDFAASRAFLSRIGV